MDALAQAKELIQDAYYDERGMAGVMRQDAAIYAAIAAAEANRPRFVRLGDHLINLAHIAYIDWHKLDREGNRCIEITFCAINNNNALGLVFRGDECDPVDAVLHSVLDPYTVAALDFPEEDDTDADESMADHLDTIKHAREQADGMRRGMGLETS